MTARRLLAKRNEKKEEQKKSLQAAGTTWQKAAEAQYIDDLAGAALAAETPEDYGN